ncbi:hypothetical protein, partial [Enhygromyxa salina]|uniref:hypothetical protein n=1 Tax=Enhygromyxa salina TaxID=215803 RepID=UPI0011B26CB1
MISLGVPAKTRAAGPPAPQLVEKAAEDTPDRVGLRVDTDDLGGAGEPLKVKIVETASLVFAEQRVEDGRDGEDPRIVIVVERTGTEENPGFVVGFSIEKGEEIVPGSARQSDCSLCTRTELVARIEQELPALLELAGEHQVAVEGVEEGGEDGGDGSDGGEELPGGDKKIGPLG